MSSIFLVQWESRTFMELCGEVGGLRRCLGEMGSEDGEVGDKIRKLPREVEEYHWTRGQMT